MKYRIIEETSISKGKCYYIQYYGLSFDTSSYSSWNRVGLLGREKGYATFEEAKSELESLKKTDKENKISRQIVYEDH